MNDLRLELRGRDTNVWTIKIASPRKPKIETASPDGALNFPEMASVSRKVFTKILERIKNTPQNKNHSEQSARTSEMPFGIYE